MDPGGKKSAECRAEARAHREALHPETLILKPRKTARWRKRTLRSAAEEEQIKVDAAEANRLRTEREFADLLAKVERGRQRAEAA